MKLKYIIPICMILLLGVFVYSQTSTTKQVEFPKADKELLQEKGFDKLPYSKITCDGTHNCTYYITRAGKNFIRDLGTKDLGTAEGKLDMDIKKYLDDNLVIFKAEKERVNDVEGTIEVIEK